MVKACNPVVFSFYYNYLRTHPLIIRRHLAIPDGTAVTVGLSAEKSSAIEINLIERKLFLHYCQPHTSRLAVQFWLWKCFPRFPKLLRNLALRLKASFIQSQRKLHPTSGEWDPGRRGLGLPCTTGRCLGGK
ncbi:hypothetical protein KUCAC02_001840 [Chaenocephalus aceratus]|uniref:Uncharacterized protein n=1 Tax=Chaenocephalus aceratus TaxID=36190 RepID=A0ACB9XTX2_CHAAC|nr:hypothetical protein KUCAC02_001840 [Chaenocephalus aceratus]